jgi:aspartate-semialdehyde dehydrogenase
MSSSSKPAISVPHAPIPRGNLYRVAIVGAASLRGKEVAEMLNERNFPAVDVRLLDDDESLGQLEALGDEISFIQSVRAEQFDNVDFTFFASDGASAQRNWKAARDAGNTIIDLSAGLESESGATVRSLWVERERGQVQPPELQPGPCVTAHPAAVVLALLLLRARNVGKVLRAAVTLFEPASQRGQKGMDELHQQTVNLLSFQPLPKDVYDAQVAFNLIGSYGQKAQPTLGSVEETVLRHYQKIAGDKAPQPSLLLLQAPVFHGYAMAVFLEMDQPVDSGELSLALTGEHVTIAGAGDEAPNNVNAAGQAEVLLSVKSDVNNANGVWLWTAFDNLRIAAISAVESAERLIATRPIGKIQ